MLNFTWSKGLLRYFPAFLFNISVFLPFKTVLKLSCHSLFVFMEPETLSKGSGCFRWTLRPGFAWVWLGSFYSREKEGRTLFIILGVILKLEWNLVLMLLSSPFLRECIKACNNRLFIAGYGQLLGQFGAWIGKSYWSHQLRFHSSIRLSSCKKIISWLKLLTFWLGWDWMEPNPIHEQRSPLNCVWVNYLSLARLQTIGRQNVPLSIDHMPTF